MSREAHTIRYITDRHLIFWRSAKQFQRFHEKKQRRPRKRWCYYCKPGEEGEEPWEGDEVQHPQVFDLGSYLRQELNIKYICIKKWGGVEYFVHIAFIFDMMPYLKIKISKKCQDIRNMKVYYSFVLTAIIQKDKKTMAISRDSWVEWFTFLTRSPRTPWSTRAPTTYTTACSPQLYHNDKKMIFPENVAYFTWKVLFLFSICSIKCSEPDLSLQSTTYLRIEQ